MELSQQLLAVGLVLALFVLAATAAQRRGWLRLNWPVRGRLVRSLELVDRLALTPQHQLHLIRTADRTLLIATHPKGFEVLESSSEAALVASRGGPR